MFNNMVLNEISKYKKYEVVFSHNFGWLLVHSGSKQIIKRDTSKDKVIDYGKDYCMVNNSRLQVYDAKGTLSEVIDFSK